MFCVKDLAGFDLVRLDLDVAESAVALCVEVA
jgi:hypothetical protein